MRSSGVWRFGTVLTPQALTQVFLHSFTNYYNKGETSSRKIIYQDHGLERDAFSIQKLQSDSPLKPLKVAPSYPLVENQVLLGKTSIPMD